MNRGPFYTLGLLLFIGTLSVWAQTPKTIEASAIALHGVPKYKAGFKHFDYVNPKAPKGGSLTLHSIGTYDNFNRYALRGLSPAGIEGLYDTLLVASDDEIEVYYPLIAEKVQYPDDYSSITFFINPAARAQNGAPITSDDVVFSFHTFYEKGVPQFKAYYEGVKVQALDRLRVRFTLPSKGDKELMLSLASLAILPKSFWSSRDFSEPLLTPPEGTGPYRVKDYKMGQYVTYERIKNYWAATLPVNVGKMNFDTIRYDYYRDDTVAFEAFKAGEYDFREENVAMNWATQYKGPAFDSGKIVKEEVPHEIPQPMQAFVFNIQRPLFQDRRVRMAINLALDFEWMNKNLFYNQYTRTRSYFQNTPYAATGLPSPEERKILEPIGDKIPPEVFTQEYTPPITDGTGNIRSQIRSALDLFKSAGWELRGQRLINVKTGEPLVFELLIYSPSTERIALPLQKNLERMGVEMKIRMVDTTQFTNRLRSRDYDMIAQGFGTNFYPSSNLSIVWRSNYIDSTWNSAGVQDPAVDYLIDGIIAHQNDEQALLFWGRALDRVLTWNHYVIPQWYISMFRLAYANKFDKPSVRPKYAVGLDTWWIK
jgi:microcin C transport system substrate-binding protein